LALTDFWRRRGREHRAQQPPSPSCRVGGYDPQPLSGAGPNLTVIIVAESWQPMSSATGVLTNDDAVASRQPGR